MQIIGSWFVDDDGVARPVVRARVAGQSETFAVDNFLLDTGADRTVFSADLLTRLGFPANGTSPGYALEGVGGNVSFILVNTVLEFTRDDGGPAHVRGEFAAFTDPSATDLSILGRDVLFNFDVILSRRRQEVLLLAPNHQYRVEGP